MSQWTHARTYLNYSKPGKRTQLRCELAVVPALGGILSHLSGVGNFILLCQRQRVKSRHIFFIRGCETRLRLFPEFFEPFLLYGI